MDQTVNGAPGAVPPSHMYTMPAAFTVSTSDAMLYSVRYSGLRVFIRKVHWLQALAPATSMVSSAPSIKSAAKSTAYDTDIDDPLLVSGRLTFRADAREENTSRAANSGKSPNLLGWKTSSTRKPAATTAQT